MSKTPYKDSALGKRTGCKNVWCDSGNYDSLNRVISFGIDIKWRKKCWNCCKNQDTILDIATGTGDLAI
jgi:demethylmenaquinone methyltransferase/2-methoxy-6-polyprenyl-1,4-benzoquinol methylase